MYFKVSTIFLDVEKIRRRTRGLLTCQEVLMIVVGSYLERS